MSRALATPVLLMALMAPGLHADDLDLGNEPTPSAFAWSGDLLLRQEWLRSWQPYGDNESRLRFRLRYGPTWQIDEHWSFGAAVRLEESSIGDEYLVDYNDNERPRDLALDTLYLEYAPEEGDRLLLGQDALPLSLSRLLWDADLRPAGVSYTYSSHPLKDNTLRLVGGGFYARYLFGIESRLTALQADWRFREDQPLQPELILSYLHFTDLDPLLAVGEDRGNPFLGGHFIDQYELADLQFALHMAGDTPFRMLLDLDKNLGAVAGNDRAGRLELVLGDSFRAGASEEGTAFERMQRSAVVGAFNEDDWWFHAGSHGVVLWYAYGFSDRLRLRASYFREQPDYSWHHWNRVLLDLQWQL